MSRIVIAGYDAITPLGTELPEAWGRMLKGESGIGRLTRFPVPESFPVQVAGQVPEIDTAAYPFLSPRRMALWPSPIFKYALVSVHRALQKSGIEITPELAPRVAVTFSSAVGGLDVVLGADRRMIAQKRLPPPYANPNSCINMVGGKVSILTGATGPILSTITACATGATSMIVGAMLIKDGRADVAICGAVDFALVEPIVAGFATMNGAFQVKENTVSGPPERASRPFSIDREGFVISEGAGAIILTSKAFAEAHGIGCGIEIAGWSMTSDAYHFVAPRLETIARSMAEAIENAGLSAQDIASVNAHAASTKVGDRVEWEALRTVFPERMPPVTANKSIIGHAMGASSAVESVFAMEGMKDDILPPTINYTPDPDLFIDCVPEGARPWKQEFVLKNAFGFGGCNSCIVFRKVGQAHP